uniref:Transcription factor RF2a n=1 Tax=Anthurium amnicola TaxID=1678845 RepID=A0A1D1YPJ2_9ARAE
MSRSAQRPPRCPFQNRGALNSPIDISTLNSDKDNEVKVQHRRFLSQGSLFEEQPLWIDDLLGDSEMSPKGVFLRRSASDSAAVLEVLSEAFAEIDIQASGETSCKTTATEARGGLEAGCVYGPNSPRHKANLDQSESSIVSALWENVPQFPFQYVTENLHSGPEVNHCNVKGDVHANAGGFDPERASRRNYGQRSRVRKLQYIAELERTVSVFQTLEADLAARVASLFQRRAVLHEENSVLRQQIASLRKEKMIKDGQCQYLKNELRKLKAVSGHHRKSKSASFFQIDSIKRDTLETGWQSLDMAKLSLR